MSESLEKISLKTLFKVANDNLKSELRQMKEYLKEIQELKDINNIEKVEELTDNLSHSLKLMRRLKMLINKFDRIEQEINELSYYAFKPENIDDDDEEQWEKEEENYILKIIDIYDEENESEFEINNNDEQKLNSLIMQEIEDEKNYINQENFKDGNYDDEKNYINQENFKDGNYEESKKIHEKFFENIKSENNF